MPGTTAWVLVDQRPSPIRRLTEPTWVMAPNVLAMATWSDGGQMMTNPYPACGRYVDRMSNHCAHVPMVVKSHHFGGHARDAALLTSTSPERTIRAG